MIRRALPAIFAAAMGLAAAMVLLSCEHEGAADVYVGEVRT